MFDLSTDTARVHKLYSSLGGMEGLPLPSATPSTGRFAALATARLVYPGFLTALTIGLAATWLSQHYNTPLMLLALLLGMAFHFLHEDTRCTAGIEFSSKAVLRFGVALLGIRITLTEIASLGALPIAIVLVGVPSTILFGRFVAQALGLRPQLGILSGGAVGICGASAALAIAAALPRTKDSERDTIFTVIAVTALSTTAMILYPILVAGLHLDHRAAGIFFGATIHDVAQVVGAGYTISQQTGDIATYVKLLRVATLIPVVASLTLIAHRRQKAQGGGGRVPLPWFLIGFAALAAASSFGLFSKETIDGVSTLSRWCLVMAISALGMKTAFKNLLSLGWRPVALMVGETLWIGALGLGAILLFG